MSATAVGERETQRRSYPGIRGQYGTRGWELVRELDLVGSNTYRGTTYVNQGNLVVANSQALGGTGVAGVQAVTLGGSTSGTFTLTFNGQTTDPIAYNAAPSLVQSALSGLSKGEIERIWLPFAPWILVAGASLDGDRATARPWLALQAAACLVLQFTIRGP